jgi:hypothetical protein
LLIARLPAGSRAGTCLPVSHPGGCGCCGRRLLFATPVLVPGLLFDGQYDNCEATVGFWEPATAEVTAKRADRRLGSARGCHDPWRE